MKSLTSLLDFVARVPRVRLGEFPTPLVPLERVGSTLGIDLWMKRDECSGVALGGNKTRKLEYILADVRKRGAHTVVTVGPLTSNHTMMTAVACRRVGLEVHCVVAGDPPARPADWHGNLLLLDYLGARLHFSPTNLAEPNAEDSARLQALCADVTADTSGYFIPGGGTMPQSEPGYMRCIAEIAQQRGGRFDFDDVVVAYGTGSTTTGILLGLALGGFAARVHAVAVSTREVVEVALKLPPPATRFMDSVGHFGLDIDAADIPPHQIRYGFADEGYGVPNRASDDAIRLVATAEGYFLDTVYTAKAFAGLQGLAARGDITPGSRVLFVHTGGLSMTTAAEKRYPGAGHRA
ncbi:MAG TPA: pyridoxal-phosphate dependent enzyme [Vicinamibacterales bacterium]|nr:pyridoxal-phosphate dependent enzyme [Vicinamibacterales bacterium]